MVCCLLGVVIAQILVGLVTHDENMWSTTVLMTWNFQC